MIGITTDLARRRTEWEDEFPDLFGWSVIAGPYNTQEEAQVAEEELASLLGCEAHFGEEGEGEWYVYRFFYVR